MKNDSDFVLRAAIIFNGNNGAYKLRLVTKEDFVSSSREHALHDPLAESKTSEANVAGSGTTSDGRDMFNKQCMNSLVQNCDPLKLTLANFLKSWGLVAVRTKWVY